MKKHQLGSLFSFLSDALRRWDETHNFTCDVCGKEVFSAERMCGSCRKNLPYNDGPVCPLCGRKVGEPGICLECKDRPLEVRKARACFSHEKEAARLVLRYKRGEKYLFRTLADCLVPLLMSEFSDADALVFVPMTVRAEKKRGYNQSRLLAEELSRRTGKPLIDAVTKQRETEQQKALGRRAREENLRGCFHVFSRVSVRGKRLLIVDDTMTTGATASELARTLCHAGAERADLLAVTCVQKKYPFGKPPEGKRQEKRTEKTDA